MTIFTVHLPNSAPDPHYDQTVATHADNSTLARAVFIPEGFSRGAFIFGPFWLLSRRLWLAFLVWVVLIIALAVLASFLTAGAAFWIFVAIEFLFGLEGNNLRRRKLERRGYRCVEIVAGAPQDGAERAFFSRWMGPEVAAVAPPLLNRVQPPSDPHSEILGHFPLPGGRG
jgi:Protein of unknown function (DUF2628)